MKLNAIVGQSGGPTAVINSSLAGVYSACKQLGVDTVYGMVHGIQGLLLEQVVDLDTYIANDLSLEALKKTPAAFLGSCRYKLPKFEKDEETYKKLFAILDKHEISLFFYIGGNDSMDTIAQLSEYAKINGSNIRFVGVPKTIDNDLPVTDHTPGYGSAAKYVATTIKEIIRDAAVYDFPFVSTVEIMGRDSGGLTAAAALAKGPDCAGADMIYLPETNFEVDTFLARIKELIRVKKSLIIAVSEGIHTADGTYVCELAASDTAVDAFGHKQMGGTAQYLSGLIKGELGCKVRAIELSTMQRCGAHLASATDVNEAFSAGAASARAAIEGQTGVMSYFERTNENPYACTTGICDVHLVANQKKDVPLEWIDTDINYVTNEYVDYALPLIQGESYPLMVNGLPFHLTR